MGKMVQVPTTQFKKDIKRLNKSGRYQLGKLKIAMDLIAANEPLPAKYVNHKLVGYENRWDCHIEGDWLLLYELDPTNDRVYWIRSGTHSDIFR
ncbi:type II toxin-antitoxin system YafQ family toxin [Enterococcus sp.]|uniref:type II toxin-antitoxin system YafQ family toxin n=1 Tax=Enterococcus sp. TaxID=35783 RepID=UPI002913AC83|nr:type II toxin-antitoxin system YafQ family toxin [Enterococcus sp.]MDU5333164.1 type II toxin-antitoxin system YafQ family toxin [Enterococcus sp.]